MYEYNSVTLLTLDEGPDIELSDLRDVVERESTDRNLDGSCTEGNTATVFAAVTAFATTLISLTAASLFASSSKSSENEKEC